MGTLAPETQTFLSQVAAYWDHVPDNEQKHSFAFMQAHKEQLNDPDHRLSKQLEGHQRNSAARKLSQAEQSLNMLPASQRVSHALALVLVSQDPEATGSNAQAQGLKPLPDLEQSVVDLENRNSMALEPHKSQLLTPRKASAMGAVINDVRNSIAVRNLSAFDRDSFRKDTVLRDSGTNFDKYNAADRKKTRGGTVFVDDLVTSDVRNSVARLATPTLTPVVTPRIEAEVARPGYLKTIDVNEAKALNKRVSTSQGTGYKVSPRFSNRKDTVRISSLAIASTTGAGATLENSIAVADDRGTKVNLTPRQLHLTPRSSVKTINAQQEAGDALHITPRGRHLTPRSLVRVQLDNIKGQPQTSDTPADDGKGPRFPKLATTPRGGHLTPRSSVAYAAAYNSGPRDVSMVENGKWSNRQRATSVLNYGRPSEHVLNLIGTVTSNELELEEDNIHETHHEEALLFDAHHAELQAKADAGDTVAKAFVQAEEGAMGGATLDIDKHIVDVEKLLVQLREAGIDLSAMQQKHKDLERQKEEVVEEVKAIAVEKQEMEEEIFEEEQLLEHMLWFGVDRSEVQMHVVELKSQRDMLLKTGASQAVLSPSGRVSVHPTERKSAQAQQIKASSNATSAAVMYLSKMDEFEESQDPTTVKDYRKSFRTTAASFSKPHVKQLRASQARNTGEKGLGNQLLQEVGAGSSSRAVAASLMVSGAHEVAAGDHSDNTRTLRQSVAAMRQSRHNTPRDGNPNKLNLTPRGTHMTPRSRAHLSHIDLNMTPRKGHMTPRSSEQRRSTVARQNGVVASRLMGSSRKPTVRPSYMDIAADRRLTNKSVIKNDDKHKLPYGSGGVMVGDKRITNISSAREAEASQMGFSINAHREREYANEARTSEGKFVGFGKAQFMAIGDANQPAPIKTKPRI